MSKPVKILLAVAVVLLACLVAGGIGVYLALRHVPTFYERELTIEPQKRKQASAEMVRRSAAMASDLRKAGGWKYIFTADQINGWLAVDLVENHPHVLPAEIHDPRVELHDHQVAIGFRYEGKFSAVVSLEADVTLQEPNVAAVRIRSARAGAVPVPLGEIMPKIQHALEGVGFDVSLREVEADPVLVIRYVPRPDRNHRPVQVDALEVREGEAYVGGTTK